MRVLLLLLGFALGAATTLAYALFSATPEVPPAQPLPRHAAVNVTLSEAFLAALVRSAIQDLPAGASIERVDVTVERDVLVVHAAIELLGRTTTGTAHLHPVLRSGQLRVDVVDTTLGAMPVPGLEQVIEREVNARIGSLVAGMNVTFTGVRVDPASGLTVTCEVDPSRIASPTVVNP